MAGVWSYLPQESLTEGLSTATLVADPSPLSSITGWTVNTAIRTIRHQYAVRESDEVASMVAFHVARFGPYEAFSLFHEGRTLSVRFDSALSTELFQAGLLRTGTVTFTTVQS